MQPLVVQKTGVTAEVGGQEGLLRFHDCTIGWAAKQRPKPCVFAIEVAVAQHDGLHDVLLSSVLEVAHLVALLVQCSRLVVHERIT